MQIRSFVATIVFATALGFSLPAVASGTSQVTINSGGLAHTCMLYVPATLSADAPAPLLLLFHGSGRDGASQIDQWKALAEAKGVLLAAPDAMDRRHWSLPEDGPELLGDIVTYMKGHYSVDTHRIYAFGHSAGAVFALRMAALESTMLAAVAVHAGALALPSDTAILSLAQRKTPVYITVGTKDQFFSLEAVHATEAAFTAAGFPVEVHEIPGHDHNYYAMSKQVNTSAWSFLAGSRLAQDAQYSRYRITVTSPGSSTIVHE